MRILGMIRKLQAIKAALMNKDRNEAERFSELMMKQLGDKLTDQIKEQLENNLASINLVSNPAYIASVFHSALEAENLPHAGARAERLSLETNTFSISVICGDEQAVKQHQALFTFTQADQIAQRAAEMAAYLQSINQPKH